MSNIFESQQLAHLVLAQYYRWYQVYEVPFTPRRIENQKDILSDSVEIVSQAGTTKGKANLEERLKVYEGWLNAHHVQNTAVQLLPDGSLSLEADIIYQNIRPDESRFSYSIHYSTLLERRENDLPLFTRLELKPTGEIKPFEFTDAYPENRCKSFLHYWLYLMETPKENGRRFHELLAGQFTLYLSDQQTIRNLEDFDRWIDSIPGRILTSTHACKDLKIVDNQDDTFSVSVNFDWKGVNAQHQNMIAESHHEWVLSNDKEDRFAKMKEMRVTMIKPFQVVD